MNVKEATVIVTGSGSGIGRALAVEFARNGAKVVCCGRRKERLDETVAQIEQQGGVGLAAPADITQRDQVQQMVGLVLSRFGAIDVLFNNAGSFQSIAGVHEVDPNLWWQDVTVNLFGPLLMIREVLPHMMKRNRGILINMNGGRPPGGTAYACSKAGLMELTRLLADELKIAKSSVMVFAAGPGLVRTEMTELQAHTESGRRWIPSTGASFASGKLRKPEEIARTTVRLVELAKPEWSGKSYGPDADFSLF